MKETSSIQQISHFDIREDTIIKNHIFNFKDFSSIIHIEKDSSNPIAKYKYVDIKAKVLT